MYILIYYMSIEWYPMNYSQRDYNMFIFGLFKDKKFIEF